MRIGRSAPARGSKLAELPPGNVVLTVVQEVERCQVPVSSATASGEPAGTLWLLYRLQGRARLFARAAFEASYIS
jgi:hypothetical protein